MKKNQQTNKSTQLIKFRICVDFDFNGKTVEESRFEEICIPEEWLRFNKGQGEQKIVFESGDGKVEKQVVLPGRLLSADIEKFEGRGQDDVKIADQPLWEEAQTGKTVRLNKKKVVAGLQELDNDIKAAELKLESWLNQAKEGAPSLTLAGKIKTFQALERNREGGGLDITYFSLLIRPAHALPLAFDERKNLLIRGVKNYLCEGCLNDSDALAHIGVEHSGDAKEKLRNLDFDQVRDLLRWTIERFGKRTNLDQEKIAWLQEKVDTFFDRKRWEGMTISKWVEERGGKEGPIEGIKVGKKIEEKFEEELKQEIQAGRKWSVRIGNSMTSVLEDAFDSALETEEGGKMFGNPYFTGEWCANRLDKVLLELGLNSTDSVTEADSTYNKTLLTVGVFVARYFEKERLKYEEEMCAGRGVDNFVGEEDVPVIQSGKKPNAIVK